MARPVRTGAATSPQVGADRVASTGYPGTVGTAEPSDLTALLHRATAGDGAAASALFDVLYADLHARAQRVASDANATLQPTALVHEAWLRLVPDRAPAFADRAHFLRAAGAAMRSALVDHVRARNAQKRGGGRQRVELDAIADVYQERALDLLALDDALRRLAERDAQLAQVVELRFFAGVPMQDIGSVLGCSTSTVERAWRTASAWLRAELAP